MKKRRMNLLWFYSLILLIPFASADLIIPFTSDLRPFFLIVIILELFAFWALSNLTFKIKVGFWKSLLIIFVANVVTSVIGIFIPSIGNTFPTILGPVLIAFVLSVIFEFLVLLLFFTNKKVKKMNLLQLSIIINAISYAVLAFLFYLRI